MSVPLKVLGDRVLVKPDVIANAPEQHGAIFVAKTLASAVTGEDPTQSVQRGTVIAVGRPKHPLKEEAESLATKLKCYMGVLDRELIEDAAAMLCDVVRKQPAVSIDDDVLFAHSSGQQITLDDQTFIILHEDELLAVVEN